MIDEMLRWLNNIFDSAEDEPSYFIAMEAPPIGPIPSESAETESAVPKPTPKPKPKPRKLPPMKCKKVCVVCGDCNLSLNQDRCIACRINLVASSRT